MIRTVFDLYQNGSPLVLDRLKREQDLPLVVINADEKVGHGQVVTVMDRVR